MYSDIRTDGSSRTYLCTSTSICLPRIQHLSAAYANSHDGDCGAGGDCGISSHHCKLCFGDDASAKLDPSEIDLAINNLYRRQRSN